MGNICRSPAAEGVLKHKLKKHPLHKKVVCDSAGTSGFHIGEPPDSRMIRSAAKRGIVLEGSSRALTIRDFMDFDLILTMDEDNRRAVYALARDRQDETKIRPFCTFLKTGAFKEIPDPYYGATSGFELVLDLLEEGCDNLLAHLASTMK